MTHTSDEVLAMERRFWEAGGDPGFFESAMDDQAITVMEPMGFISKGQAVEMSRQGEGWVDVQMQDVNVVELTPDCVAIAYHGKAKGSKSGRPYAGSISSVYVRRDGHWKLGMTSHQPWHSDEKPKGSD